MIAEAVKHMLAAGMGADAIVAAVRDMEACIAPVRSAGAKRQERYRRNKASLVTDSDAPAPLSSPPLPSPTPPTKTPPIIPPPSDAPADLARQIFELQPAKHRRSTTPDIRMALNAAIKRGGNPDQIISACRAYFRHPDQIRDDGKFAKAAHRIIEADRWRDFLPPPDRPKPQLTGDALASCVRHYRDTGEWRPAWGPMPKEIAA